MVCGLLFPQNTTCAPGIKVLTMREMAWSRKTFET